MSRELSYKEEDDILEHEREKDRKKNYTLVVDCGIPYEEKLNKTSLMRQLKKLKKKRDEPYCDISIYRGKKDVTTSIFKKLHKKKRR